MKNRYTEAFKEQALLKVYGRKNCTINEIAGELNMNVGTLKGWMRGAVKSQTKEAEKPAERASDFSLAARLKALQESHGLSGEELNAWCRARGLFTHHLQQWTADFCQTKPAVSGRQNEDAQRASNKKIQTLEAELRRKEKALAEAAALLVLQKKFRAYLGGEES